MPVLEKAEMFIVATMSIGTLTQQEKVGTD